MSSQREQITFNKFGRNSDLGTTQEDIWDAGGLWIKPTFAQVHTLVSTDATDTDSNVGAHEVRVEGLDAANLLAEEIVALNGLTPVPTSIAYSTIFRMEVISAGTSDGNVGTITATAVSDGTVTAQINPTNNQTLMAIFTVPINYRCQMLQYYASGRNHSDADIQVTLYGRPIGGVWTVRNAFGLRTGGSSYVRQPFVTPQHFLSGSDIRVAAQTISAPSVIVSAGFDVDLHLIRDF